MHNKISKDGQRKLSIVVCVTIFLMITITSVHAISKDGNVDLYPPDSKPYGLTFGEWASKWHTWLYSIPAPINPATDTTGKNCAQNQAGPVWFLAGTTGGAVDRTCSVPAGKGLVFPIISRMLFCRESKSKERGRVEDMHNKPRQHCNTYGTYYRRS